MTQNIFDTLKAELLGDQPMLSAADVVEILTDELNPCLGLNEGYPIGNDNKHSLGVFFLTSSDGAINAQISKEITQPLYKKEQVEERSLEPDDLPQSSHITINLINIYTQEMLTIDNTHRFEVTHQSLADRKTGESLQIYNEIKETVAAFNTNPKIATFAQIAAF